LAFFWFVRDLASLLWMALVSFATRFSGFRRSFLGPGGGDDFDSASLMHRLQKAEWTQEKRKQTFPNGGWSVHRRFGGGMERNATGKICQSDR